MKFGSVTTGIIADGLVFNMDAANRASYIPNSSTSYNTANLSESGSLQNDTSFITTPTSASSWHFDGTDDSIQFSSLQSYSSDDPHTYSAWIKFRDGASGTYAWILNNSAGATGDSLVLATSRMGFFWKGGSAVKRIDSSLSTDTWYNFTICYDGSALTYRMYVNGTLELSSDTSDTTAGSGTTWSAGNSNPAIGTWYDGRYDFDGVIANIQIYNRSLTSTEVLHNYNALKGRFGLT
jgi:hypothetical protein